MLLSKESLEFSGIQTIKVYLKISDYEVQTSCIEVQISTTIRTYNREVDATEFEWLQLLAYSKAHPKATQQQLSQWFSDY